MNKSDCVTVPYLLVRVPSVVARKLLNRGGAWAHLEVYGVGFGEEAVASQHERRILSEQYGNGRPMRELSLSNDQVR